MMVRTVFTVDVDGTVEQAMSQLNRKMKGFMKKHRQRLRGRQKPSEVRRIAEQKKLYHRSYERVQKVLAYVEEDRREQAKIRKEERHKEKMAAMNPNYDDDEYYDAILEGRMPPELH